MFIVKNCVDKLQFKYGVENNLVDVSKRVEKLSNNWIYISKDKNTLFGDPVPMVEKYLQVFDCEKLLHSIPENDFGFFNSVSHELVLNPSKIACNFEAGVHKEIIKNMSRKLMQSWHNCPLIAS